MSYIEFNVDGVKCKVDDRLPRETSLNAYLRYHLGLSGTKAMCHQGGCGSCLVMVRAQRPTSGAWETFSVNSCLVLVFSCHGWEITTVEGVGGRCKGYSDVQKRIVEFNGTQCGYCTPGWVMQMTSLLDKHLTMAELEKSFGSNQCRCTGYRSILDTMKSFADDAPPEICMRVKDMEDLGTYSIKCDRKCSLTDDDWCIVNESCLTRSSGIITLDFGKNKFFKVFKLSHIYEVLYKYGMNSYMLADGNTAKGVIENFEYPNIIIDISNVSSLKSYKFDQNLVLGANISLQDCIRIFKDTAKSKPEFAYLSEFVKHLELVAHIPVRKIGSLAGNLMLKHSMPAYQSDIFLLMETVGASMTVVNSNGRQRVLSLTDFLGYNMRGVVMLDLKLPPFSSKYIFRSYKVMPRSQNALAIVNAGFLIKLNGNKVEEASIVYGNISADFIHAVKTEKFLKRKNLFDDQTLQGALKVLDSEVYPKDHPPEPSPQCRKKMALGLFYKFVLNLSPPGIPSSLYRSGGQLLTRPVSSGTHDYQTDPALYPLNKPVSKLEGLIQSSGEAEYANDVPNFPHQVFAAFVLSTVHNGDVDKIDATDALKIPGVLALFTAKDIPGKNSFILVGLPLETEDEEILADKNIKFYGQPIAIIVAEREALAVSAAKKVNVTYTNVKNVPPVLTINDAKKDKNRYIPGADNIEPKGQGTDVKEVIKGVYEIGAQYHYYLEPMTCVVVPVDHGLEIYDSTQWMDLTQTAVAQSLNINESNIRVIVRRLGGGFGGKLSRNVQVSTSCALVANKMGRPCRFILPIETNLTIAGRRLPCQCTYEAGVDTNGKIQYLNAEIVEDGGCSNNENVLAFTVGGFPNCYDSDYFSLKTASVLTDRPSNTFARAPGTMEGISCIENIMEHISYAVNRDPTDVRLANLNHEDQDISEMIKNLKNEADYDKRLKAVNEFNKANRWMKKAIKISVMKFPVQFYGNYSSMVSIYQGDGTVTVTTGGIEMGQGVNTKCAQVCAYELGIPLDKVTVIPSYSFVASNNVFSGSSIVSESVCYAIIKCCNQLKKRLAPVKSKMANPSWLELINKAGQEYVDLVATYMMSDKETDLGSYNAYAVTIIEVQMDVILGRFQIERVDILEDAGLSANPKIDIGQVQGAYVQGLSYYTTEKFVYDVTTGALLSNRTLKYDVFQALDIPVDFRVKLRYNSDNPKGVLGAKAVGEMGICSSYGILHALRACIAESRKDSGYDPTEYINIDVPYDAESILKALNVSLSEFILTNKRSSD